MKLMFFSDIHGNKYILPNLAAAIRTIKPDNIIFCGDIYGYYYYQDEVIRFFEKFNVQSICGNHDKFFLDLIANKISLDFLTTKFGNSYALNLANVNKKSFEYVRKLEPKKEMKIDNLKIGIFHGSPEDNYNGRVYSDTIISNTKLYNKFDYVILGHTHHKMIRKVGKTTILNPGSIGQQRDGLGFSYLLLDTKTKKFSFQSIEINLNKLIKDIKKNDPGNSSLIEVLLRKRSSPSPCENPSITLE